MKRRVIETLYKNSFTDPDARKKLLEILHDYSSFNILTIDRFFQQTLRAFAREIGKNNSYSVELDDDMVLSEAIDSMILNLDLDNNSQLLDWFTEISFDAIEQGDSWNLKKGIKDFAGQIFKESFRIKKSALLPESFDKQTLRYFKDSLKTIIDHFENHVIVISKNALEILERHNLSQLDFPSKMTSGINFFYKCASGDITKPSVRFLEMADNIDKWTTNVTKRKDIQLCHIIENAYNEGLNDSIVEMIAFFETHFINYKSAKMVLSNINILGLLIDVERFVKEYSKENNIVLIPETTELLNRIIDGSDAPFIYEKVGTRIDHFMLDEFQDTSLMQWNNFKPLIDNSLSSGYDNLIVGDVKQSIYRWRGSDWNLLNGDICNYIQKERIIEHNLQYNWRSAKEIVNFNNELFTYTALICDSLINSSDFSKVYQNVSQTVPLKNEDINGHVLLKFFETDQEADSWQLAAINNIAPLIEQYREGGYRYSDIAILVRTNKEGESIVKNLIASDYPVISEESLIISYSPAVRRVLTILYYLDNPNDPVNNAVAQYNNINTNLTEGIEYLPLFELCENIVASVQGEFDHSDTIYIQSFMDVVSEYLKNGRADLSSFLEWWKLRGNKKSLSAPWGQDAIRVMTIHKAKGLGFPVVIVPLFQAVLDTSGNSAQYIWCNTHVEPFSQLPLIPVKYSSSLEDTIFNDDYQKEKIKTYTDNTNVAYVALTRAERELAIFSALPSKQQQRSVSDFMYYLFKERFNSSFEYHAGSWTTVTDNSIDEQNEKDLPPLLSIPYGQRLRLSLKGEEYFDKESRRNFGLIMHSVLSRIEAEEDLEVSLKFALSQGEIKSGEYEPILQMLKKCLESVRARHWFDGTYKVYNELEIIEPGGKISRPDRVLSGGEVQIIDFKFGDKKEKSHIRQVENYISLARQSGLAYVKGYLWYPMDNEIIEISGGHSGN